MGIEQLSLGDYFQMESTDEIQVMIENVKANPIIRYKSREIKPKQESLWMMPWGGLLGLRESITENMFDALYITHGMKLGALVEVPVLNVFACYEWVAVELKSIADAENDQLHREPTAKELNAGIENYQDFGYANQLRALRGKDATKDEELLKLPYAIIFRELCMNKVDAEYQEAYSRQK